MSNEIQILPNDAEGAWSLAQRKAKALVAASLVPEAYRGTNGLPNALIALEIAERLGASPLLVMQNLHIIQGRPSWSASFLIATVNQCGRFTPMRFETRGDDPRAPDYRVRAYAEDKASGERCVGEWVDWTMVQGEGWDKKNGSKWRTMPGQMFRYRAAAFWTRVFAPEVSMGIYTADEVEDMSDAQPKRGVVAVDLSARMAAIEPEPPPSAPQPQQTADTPPATENEAQASTCAVCGVVSAEGPVDASGRCVECATANQ